MLPRRSWPGSSRKAISTRSGWTVGIIRCFAGSDCDDPALRESSPKKPKVNEATVEQPISAANLNKRIQELERECRELQARVKRLQNAGKTVITQREEWQTRALAAEDRLKTERRRPMNPDKRFDALRRLIAKELHPDFSTDGDLDKLLRAEYFKKLWPEIERLVERK